jgi:hypothetical protein
LLPLQLLQPLQGRLEAEQLLYLQLQRLFKQPNKTVVNPSPAKHCAVADLFMPSAIITLLVQTVQY